ncbi:cobyrinate a,c-diamide synthase [Ornithinimicrobium sufpigmenti]|uniref:cobyrinate a,c-diamide synthase n=1 Tax=Ornithinimicrobium sufpigmenti TaxID=2508882 RepID=UPI001EE05AE2|nr:MULTISPECIES: cobyrinate a,c-diamide synthase [unclassified Ornithinimicrobium]
MVVAAPASGQGKTTVSVGLMAALTARGLTVAPGKVGPDYIDPGYHALATGRPGRNLDPWLVGAERVPGLLVHAARTPTVADLTVVEGVMGLFDGRNGTDGESSTAHVARLLGAPVVLVVDAGHASGTVAATVHGLRTFDPRVQVAGVVLNRTGSPGHAAEVTRWVERLGLPVLGALPRDAAISAPSRHLGLVPAAERADAAAALERLAERTARHVDLDAVLDVARSAPPLDAEPWSPEAGSVAGRGGRRPVVAVAGGRAFTFRYAETEELLRAAGCDVLTLDPAVDRALPAGVAGLYLGGGFPEVHAAALSTNTGLLGDVRDAVAAGLPTVAECAGLLYLTESVDGHPFAGVVPATAAMAPRLTLGYAGVRTAADSVLGPAGTTATGHEFHRTVTDPASGQQSGGRGAGAAWTSERGPSGFALDPAGTGRATVHAAYLHTHWAGQPHLARSFTQAVAEHDRAGLADRVLLPRPCSAPTAVAEAGVAEARTPVISKAIDDPDLTHHGDRETAPDLVDLAVNVRLPEPPAWLATVVASTSRQLAAYPDPAHARAALARRHGVAEDMVLPTAGAAEAFTLLARAGLCARALVVHPQFTEPEAAVRRAGLDVERHLLDPGEGFCLDPQAVGPADLVLIGNPTNPTGVLHPVQTLRDLHARTGGVLVVDEAFLDEVVDGERQSLIAPSMPGVLVLRSLTKTWGLAGLRVGYVVGDPALVARLAAQQPPWSVSTPALAAMVATAAPSALAEAGRMALELEQWRHHLDAGLRALGVEVVPSEAPFLLARVGRGVREALRAWGYAVRRGDTFPGLDATWVRIAVRDPLTIDGMLRELRAVLTGRALTPARDIPQED